MKTPVSVHPARVLTLGAVLLSVLAVYRGLPEGVVLPKTLVAQAVGLLAFAGWVLTHTGRRAERLRLTALDGLVGLFLAWGLFNAARQHHLTPGTACTQVLLGLWYGFARRATPAEGPWLAGVLAAVMLVEAGWVLGQSLGWLPALHAEFGRTGSFYNPAHLGMFAALALPWLLAFGFSEKKRPTRRAVAWGTVVVAGGLLVVSQSRTAWLAAGVGGLAVAYAHAGGRMRAFFRNKHSVAWAWLVLPLLLGVGYALFRWKEASALGRLLIWKVALRMLADRPLAGFGFGGVARQYNHYQAAYLSGPHAPGEWANADAVFVLLNDYLQLAVEQGLIGLGLWLAVLAVAFRAFGRPAPDPLRTGAQGALLAAAVAMGFSCPYQLTSLALPVFLALGLLGRDAPAIGSLPSPLAHRLLGRPLALLLAVACLAALWAVPLRTALAHRAWQRAIDLERDRGIRAALPAYEAVAKRLDREAVFRVFFGKALARARQYRRSAELLEATRADLADPWLLGCLGDDYRSLGEYDRAERCYRQLIALLPNRLTPLHGLLLLAEDRRDPALTRQTARRILDLPVKVPSAKANEIRKRARVALARLPAS